MTSCHSNRQGSRPEAQLRATLAPSAGGATSRLHLAIYILFERQRERDRASMCWLVPQMPTTARAGSRELHLGLPSTGATCRGHQGVHVQRAAWELREDSDPGSLIWAVRVVAVSTTCPFLQVYSVSGVGEGSLVAHLLPCNTRQERQLTQAGTEEVTL